MSCETLSSAVEQPLSSCWFFFHLSPLPFPFQNENVRLCLSHGSWKLIIPIYFLVHYIFLKNSRQGFSVWLSSCLGTCSGSVACLKLRNLPSSASRGIKGMCHHMWLHLYIFYPSFLRYLDYIFFFVFLICFFLLPHLPMTVHFKCLRTVDWLTEILQGLNEWKQVHYVSEKGWPSSGVRACYRDEPPGVGSLERNVHSSTWEFFSFLEVNCWLGWAWKGEFIMIPIFNNVSSWKDGLNFE